MSFHREETLEITSSSGDKIKLTRSTSIKFNSATEATFGDTSDTKTAFLNSFDINLSQNEKDSNVNKSNYMFGTTSILDMQQNKYRSKYSPAQDYIPNFEKQGHGNSVKRLRRRIRQPQLKSICFRNPGVKNERSKGYGECSFKERPQNGLEIVKWNCIVLILSLVLINSFDRNNAFFNSVLMFVWRDLLCQQFCMFCNILWLEIIPWTISICISIGKEMQRHILYWLKIKTSNTLVWITKHYKTFCRFLSAFLTSIEEEKKLQENENNDPKYFKKQRRLMSHTAANRKEILKPSQKGPLLELFASMHPVNHSFNMSTVKLRISLQGLLPNLLVMFQKDDKLKSNKSYSNGKQDEVRCSGGFRWRIPYCEIQVYMARVFAEPYDDEEMLPGNTTSEPEMLIVHRNDVGNNLSHNSIRRNRNENTLGQPTYQGDINTMHIINRDMTANSSVAFGPLDANPFPYIYLGNEVISLQSVAKSNMPASNHSMHPLQNPEGQIGPLRHQSFCHSTKYERKHDNLAIKTGAARGGKEEEKQHTNLHVKSRTNISRSIQVEQKPSDSVSGVMHVFDHLKICVDNHHAGLHKVILVSPIAEMLLSFQKEFREHEDYFVDGKVAEGSFGEVFICSTRRLIQGKTRNRIAMKKIPLRKFNLTEVVIPVLYASSCRQILQQYFVVIEQNQVKIFMEYAAGGCFKDMKNKRWKPKEIRTILKNLLECLSFLHEQNVVHFDLKSSNIGLRVADDASTTVMFDHGSAKSVRSSRINLVLNNGTLRYISPEYCKHISSLKRFDDAMKACDIWQLGCFLFRLICGHDILENYWNQITKSGPDGERKWKEFISNVNQSVIDGEIERLEEIHQAYCRDLLMLLQIMLKVDPKRRITADDALMLLHNTGSLDYCKVEIEYSGERVCRKIVKRGSKIQDLYNDVLEVIAQKVRGAETGFYMTDQGRNIWNINCDYMLTVRLV